MIRLALLTFVAVVVGLGILAVVLAGRVPRGDRVWAVDHAVPARISRAGDAFRIDDLRDFAYGEDGTMTPRYRTEEVDLDDVRRVWFVLAPFASRWRGLAHSFVSFELEGDRFVAVSVEARREADEAYSLVKGVMRGFELTYVIGTERDLIGLRALRGDTLYMYPSRATPEQARSMFADMMRRAEEVRVEPEFYNTLVHSCSTTLRDHVNRVVEDPLPWGWGVLFPGYSDALALEQGLLDTDLPIDRARARFRIDERARSALANGASFGLALRGEGD